MAGEVRIGGIRADITARDAKFQAAVKRSNAALKRQQREMRRTQRRAKALTGAFKSMVGPLGALATFAGVSGLARGFAEGAKGAAEFSTKLVEAADNAGVAVSRMEALAHVAEQDGVSLSSLSKSITTLSRRVVEANDGLATYVREFDRIGVAYQTLQNLSPEEQFFIVAEAIARTTDRAAKQAAAQNLLGRAGRELIGTLDKHAGRLREVVAETDAITKATDAQYRSVKDLTGQLSHLARIRQDLRVQLFDDETIKDIERVAEFMVRLEKAAFGMAAGIATAAENIRYYSNLFGSYFSGTFNPIEDAPFGAPMMDRPGGDRGVEVHVDLIAQREKRLALAAEQRKRIETGYLDALQRRLVLQEMSAELAERSAEAARQALEREQARQQALAAVVEQYRQEAQLASIKARGGGRGGDPRIFTRGDLRAGRLENDERLARWEQERLDAEAADARADESRKNRLAEINRILEEQEARWQAIGMSAQEGFADILSGSLTGQVQSLGDAFKQLAVQIAQAAIKAAILQAITASIGGGGGGPAGIFGSLFGGFRAEGGPVRAGVPYIVGERGRELMVPGQNGVVVPAGGMGGGLSVTVQVDARGLDGPAAEAAVDRALGRNAPALIGAMRRALEYPSQTRRAVLGR